MQFPAVTFRLVFVRFDVRISAALSFFYGFSQAVQEKWCVNITTNLRPVPSRFLSSQYIAGDTDSVVK
jgi:hypothetical protein